MQDQFDPIDLGSEPELPARFSFHVTLLGGREIRSRTFDRSEIPDEQHALVFDALKHVFRRVTGHLAFPGVDGHVLIRSTVVESIEIVEQR